MHLTDRIYIDGIDYKDKKLLKICCTKNDTNMTKYLRGIVKNIIILIKENPESLPEVRFRTREE